MGRPKGTAVTPRVVALIGEESAHNMLAALPEEVHHLESALSGLAAAGELQSINNRLKLLSAWCLQIERDQVLRAEALAAQFAELTAAVNRLAGNAGDLRLSSDLYTAQAIGELAGLKAAVYQLPSLVANLVVLSAPVGAPAPVLVVERTAA